MSYIFLEQSLDTHTPGAGNRCKVIFSSPKYCLTPRQVIAGVKNPYTIKVRVPHCPSKFQFVKQYVYVFVQNFFIMIGCLSRLFFC